MPQSVVDVMSGVLSHGVSNLGGDFGASHDAEKVVAQGRLAMADLFNADQSEISFGQNMTSITFAVSGALARTWEPGDAIVVTSLDHDANFTPWVRAAEESGVEVRMPISTRQAASSTRRRSLISSMSGCGWSPPASPPTPSAPWSMCVP